MNFTIRQHSQYPILTMEVLEDGINTYTVLNERLQNATVLFYMEEIGSCIPVIQCGECCILVDEGCDECNEKVYIQYKWTKEDTSRKGKFKGWFEITFLDDTTDFIAPIKETLFITIL